MTTEPAPEPSRRRPHFRRHNPPPVVITEDDVALIRHVAEHRFRRSTDLVRLFPARAPKKIVERLGILFHTGYLDRPAAQRDYFIAGKKAAYVYGLGNRGAELLATLGGTQSAKVDWTDKNRDVGRPYLHHRLLIGDIVTAIRGIPAHRPDVTVIEPSVILERSPAATQADASPWTWHAKIPRPDGTLFETQTVPDHVFGLDFMAVRKRSYFFVEADRATMPILRRNPLQSSIAKKLSSYLYGHRARQHHARYTIGNLRFLIVTTTQERVASMTAAAHELGDGQSALFLFTDITTLAGAADLLAVRWKTAAGEITLEP